MCKVSVSGHMAVPAVRKGACIREYGCVKSVMCVHVKVYVWV